MGENLDRFGRKWMVSEEGLSLTKSSMSRLMIYVLSNNIKIGEIYAFNPKYKGSLVIASFLIKPEQIEEFEKETKCKLKNPPKIKLN